jgi:hypothetical protein
MGWCGARIAPKRTHLLVLFHGRYSSSYEREDRYIEPVLLGDVRRLPYFGEKQRERELSPYQPHPHRFKRARVAALRICVLIWLVQGMNIQVSIALLIAQSQFITTIRHTKALE